jgi:hypothetical protein
MHILAQDRTPKNPFRQLLSIAILIGWLIAIQDNVRAEDPPTHAADQAQLQRFKQFIEEQTEKTTSKPIPPRGRRCLLGRRKLREQTEDGNDQGEPDIGGLLHHVRLVFRNDYLDPLFRLEPF